MNRAAWIAAALDEDLGRGDVTTSATIDPAWQGSGTIRAKQDLVVSGVDAARLTFDEVGRRLGSAVHVEARQADGDHLTAGAVVAEVHGPLQALLVGERLALNLLMRLSGIATHTASVVAQLGNSATRLVDTRKTTPLHRTWEKDAVRHGGARNHRFGLDDGVLVKDNHVDAVGGVAQAVARARAGVHHLLRVQVEVRTVAELDVALGAGADAVLLDHFDDEALRAAVQRVRDVRPEVFVEASGEMTAERICRLKDIGLDAISMGGLIHQARWVDLSMKIARVA